MDYEIAKRIIYKEKYIHSGSSEKGEKTISYINIVRKGNRFGIFSDDKEELIPCEYDNITYLRNDIFQLVKNGKIGIANIEECDDECPSQQLKTLISCEYDSLDHFNSMDIVVLKKDELEGQKCRAYFPQHDMLTDWYDDYKYLGRGIIELYNSNGNDLYDAFEGKLILSHNNLSYAIFDVLLSEPEDPDDIFYDEVGVVIHAVGDRFSLVFYDRNTVKQYLFEGVLHPIYGTDSVYDESIPLVTGFVIKDKEGCLILLDEHCEPIRIDPAWIEIKTRVEVCGKRYHEITEYPLSSKAFCCYNIIEELFGEINEFAKSP